MLAVTVLEIFGVLGVIAASVIAVGVCVIVYFIWRFKRAIKSIKPTLDGMREQADKMRRQVNSQQVDGAAKPELNPTSIGLVPVDDADATLAKQPALRDAVEQFESSGLVRGGVYRTPKMPGVFVATLADPARGVTVTINSGSRFGTNYDIVTRYVDGGAITHRTMKSLGLDYPANLRHVVIEGASPADLLAAHLADRDAGRPTRAIEPANVVEAIEEYTATVARWRDARGGLTADEVRRNRDAVGRPESEAIVQRLVDVSREESKARQQDMRIPAFLAASGWTEADWATRGEKTLFVSDRTTVVLLCDSLDRMAGPSISADARADLIARTAIDGPRVAIYQWSDEGGLALERIVTFDAPEPTDVYEFRP